MKYKRGIFSILMVLILMLTGCSLPNLTSNSNSTPSTSTAAITPPTSLPSAAGIQGSAGAPPPSSSLAGSVPDSPLAMEILLESIYLQVNPSVVNIQVLEKPQATLPVIPGLIPSPGQQYSSALGSGFVWDTAGHIVTNNHVVTGAESISVTFSDGNIFHASLVGTDPDSDLAVIKVDVPEAILHPIGLADSTQLKVGQLTVAIGNPFGLQGTMTVGFLSGLGRILPANENATGASYSIPDIIQTDAPINPGNSGGVLLNNAGKVIGVTSAIATQSGSSAGVGFAIPSAIVQKVVPGLIRSGHYDHPWLGVIVVSLIPEINQAMNLKSGQRGALVEEVMPDSPAQKAGLKASSRQVSINGIQIPVGGDVITAFGGQAVKSSNDLVTDTFESGSIGQTVSLTILRNGQEIQVPVTLAARPGS